MVIRLSVKRIFGFLLAMCPILRYYNMPFLNVNLALIIILLAFGYVFLREFRTRFRGLKKCKAPVLVPIFVMCLYSIVAVFISISNIPSVEKSFSGIFVFYIELLLVAFIFFDKDLRKYHNKYLASITVFMSWVIVGQYIFYYVFGLTLSEGRAFLLPFPSLFIDSVTEYVTSTSMVIDGLFRPSAFFLEPAHMGRYCLLGLIFLLNEEEKTITKRKMLITLAIIMSTSGIGIAALLAIWMFWLFFGNDKVTKKIISRIAIILLVAVIALVVAYFTVPFFKETVDRVINSGDGYNAIAGRLGTSYLVTQLEGIAAWFGMGFKNYPTYGMYNTLYYMTGIIKLLYCQGWIGFLVFAICVLYMVMMIKQKNDKLAITVIVMAIMYIIGSDWFLPLTMISYFPFLYIENHQKGINHV